jgi:hypothetical protein
MEFLLAWRKEMVAMRDKRMDANHDKTLACQEMEARQDQEQPISRDRKPEAAQKEEVPAEDATVMPVGEPRKKRRRDRQLAAEHRHQKQKNSTWENCAPPCSHFCQRLS